MENTEITFTDSDLVGCFEELGFASLPTDWCDFLFENDCHAVEVYRTPQDNMFRLLWQRSGIDSHMALYEYWSCLVYLPSRVVEFAERIQNTEKC